MVVPINLFSDDPFWIYMLVTAICLYLLGNNMRSQIYSGRITSEFMSDFFLKIASFFILLSKIIALTSVLLATYEFLKK